MLLVVLLSAFTKEHAQATVGGPSFISTFTYSPANESIYYIKKEEGGRGCPPELMKMSLVSGRSDVVFSCTQGESLLGTSDSGVPLVNMEISKITKDFKILTPIDLKKNQIFIDVSFLNSEKYSPESNEMLKSNFNGAIYQDNRKIAELSITGCTKEQPFLFAGYAIPGFERKIVLLLSTKGDCAEGGYINETLYVVGGVSSLNREYFTNSYKGLSALTAGVGTLTVFESDETEIKAKIAPIKNTNTTDIQVAVKDIPATTPKDTPSLFTTIGIVLISVLSGLFVGRLLYKK